MSNSTRRTLLFVVLPVLVLAALGSLIFWVVLERLSRNQLDEATQLSSIALPAEPSLLGWSADGSYLAAGTGYTSWMSVHGPAKVFVVDVGKQAVVAIVETSALVDGLAFSPDGKWLAVATGHRLIDGEPGGAELMVFGVPGFTAKMKAKSANRKTADSKGDYYGFFVDIAWTPDGKSLHAIDGGLMKAKIRRWTAPEFVEQPAILAGEGDSWLVKALAVAPDGVTLAVVQDRLPSPGVLHLFDLGTGRKTVSIKDVPCGYFRAAFTPDGKTVGVFAGIEGLPLLGDILDPDGKQKRKQQRMSWWDAGTGQPASPANPRFAIQPAAQADSRTYSISPDCRMWAHALLFTRGKDDPNGPHSRYVVLTRTDTAKTWTWWFGTENRPSLAFSPDGTKLAGTLKTPSGWTIAIWAVP